MSGDVAGKTESILDIIKGIDSKTIMLPEFQRDFRWEINQTCDLFDSLIQDIFIGAIIYGKPSFAMSLREIDKRKRKGKGSRQSLKIESYSEIEIKKKRDAENLRIVLDGQQRITSIYRAVTGEGDDKVYVVLQNDLHEREIPKPNDLSLEELYSIVSSEESREAISIKLSDVYEYESNGLEDEDLNRKFLDSQYGKSLQVDNEEAISKCQRIYRVAVRKVRDLFKESKMVSYYLLDMDLEKFCTFFERSNSRGIQLNFTDILAAKLYQGFNLRKAVEDFENQNHGVKVNREVLIRAIAYIYCIEKKQGYFSIEKEFILKNLEHADFNRHWQDICSLYVKTLNFLKKNHWIVNQDWMPSENMLIPLMMFLRQIKEFDSVNQDQKKFLEYWYWASTFANRYSTSSNEVITSDCKVLSFVANKDRINNSLNFFNRLRPLVTEAEDLFNYTKKSSAIYKGVHNLINYSAGGTINWNNTQTSTGKLEDHHIYPRAYITGNLLLDTDPDEAEQLMDSVVNRTLIAEGLNVKIGKKAPHVYLSEIFENNPDLPVCLEKHYIPKELIGDAALGKFFKKFLDDRAKRIFSVIEKYAIQPTEDMKEKFGSQANNPLSDLRRSTMKDLISLGLLKVGDLIYIGKNPDKVAKVLDYKNIEFEGQQMTIHAWIELVIGKKSRSIYKDVYLHRTQSSIDTLRQI
jgi:hypothetical protein